jgi:hypothetical protein
MWQSTKGQWWSLLVVAVFLVAAWPPADERSLLLTGVNWVADPSRRLPTLPGPLPLGQGDDPAVVEAHDLETRMYDELYAKGGWTRLRLQLKVARDPLPPTTQRQLLVIVGVVAAFVIWRWRRFS